MGFFPRHGFFNRMKELGADGLRKIRQLLGQDNRSDPLHHEKSIGDMPQLHTDRPQLPNVYMPKMFSLGPFYPLPETKDYKNETIKSKLDDNRLKNLVQYMIQIDQLTSRIRQWYDSSERWNDYSKWNDCSKCPRRSKCPRSNTDLCKMMALDGFFLLQFLRSSSNDNDVEGTSTSHRPLSQQLEVQENIMRLFNQIPLFVLKNILEWEASTEKIEADTDQKLHSILKDAWINLSPIRYSWDSHMSWTKEWHLLQFVYENIISSSDLRNPNKRRKKNRNKQWKKRDGSLSPLPTAVQLKEKGVKFAELEKGLLQEIHFDYRTGTLYLPVIEMDDKTDSVLRNLVAFEAASQKEKYKPALMRYVDMMDRLINTADDVEVLKNGGVIHSHMGNDDHVANVWNGLREVVNKNGKYEPIDTAVDEVMAFYTSKFKNLYTEFKRRYCSRPWLVISVISACILLVLTVLQTILAWEQVRLQLESMHKMHKMAGRM